MKTALLVIALLVAPTVASARDQQPLEGVRVLDILNERVNTQRQSVGIAVGILSPEGRRLVAVGNLGIKDGREIDADTVFEIGSVTKIFTGWLLADMARKGEVALTDRIAGGKSIALVDLATHTAGMPFWPSNVAAGDLNAALARYTVEDLDRFVAGFDPPANIGTQWAYNNVDAGLLGVILGRRAGSSYDRLLAERITTPLRMASTSVVPTPDMQSRHASGHTVELTAAPTWNVPALAGAGSLHSTIADLLNFIGAMADPKSPIGMTLPAMLETRRQAPGFQQAIGWMVLPHADGEILFHDGQTHGFASSIAFDPKARTAVIVLSNAAAGVGDLARHVLRPSIPLAKPAGPAAQKTAVQIDARILDSYVGRYEPAAGVVYAVAREGDALMLTLPGLPPLRLLAEGPRDFYVAENSRVTVTFTVGPTGAVTALVLKSPTGSVTAKRL